MHLIVAITGASGVIYGLRLIEILREKKIKYFCMVSDAAKKIISHEVGGSELVVKCIEENKIDAEPASGSSRMDGMIIIPCSMKTLSAVANGYATNIITRSADVMIKEKKRLVLVPRETPVNPIQLENMLKLSRIGVVVLPAMPAYYHRPKKVDDLVDFVVGKALDALDIENDLFERWKVGP